MVQKILLLPVSTGLSELSRLHPITQHLLPAAVQEAIAEDSPAPEAVPVPAGAAEEDNHQPFYTLVKAGLTCLSLYAYPKLFV